MQIVCVDESGKFKWDKAIARASYITTGENQPYYQMLRENKLILFYCDSYLMIDVNTGENIINPNKDFSLQNDFEIKLDSQNKEAVVFTRHKRNKKQIGIIQFED